MKRGRNASCACEITPDEQELRNVAFRVLQAAWGVGVFEGEPHHAHAVVLGLALLAQALGAGVARAAWTADAGEHLPDPAAALGHGSHRAGRRLPPAAVDVEDLLLRQAHVLEAVDLDLARSRVAVREIRLDGRGQVVRPLRPALARLRPVVIKVWNGDAFRVSETDNTTNRESITILPAAFTIDASCSAIASTCAA